jgi:hypothetical protein
VQVEIAGIRVKKVRIATRTPDVPDNTLRAALTPYGEVLSVTEEQWNKFYLYKVSNGVRVAETSLRKHLPSIMNIVNNRVQGCRDESKKTPTLHHEHGK